MVKSPGCNKNSRTCCVVFVKKTQKMLREMIKLAKQRLKDV